ncbi:MAG TPA: cupin domain-containing protein [Pyrinomonadaceae bacterium]
MSLNAREDQTLTSALPLLSNAQHLNWSSIPVEHPAEGIERQMVVGEHLMICRFRFAPLLVTPQHTHPHEQMSLVVSGRVRFFADGTERLASPGDVLHFPSNCLHGATMLDEEVVLIDIFTPVREDFLETKDATTSPTPLAPILR